MESIVVTINGKDRTLDPEEFHPYEPSAYVYDPGWTAYDADGVEFFVSVSGDVFQQPGNVCVGSCPALAKQQV